MLNDFAPISNSLSTTDSTFVFSQQHDKELAAGTSRVGWIFWCVDESGKLKIESVSQSVEKLGLQSVKPGMPVEQLGTCVRENDRTAFTEHFAACLGEKTVEPVCVKLRSEERWLEFETQVQDTKDGQKKFQSTVIDVTRRTQLEFENTHLNQIIDAIPSWVFLKNEDHQYVRVNPAYSSVYNLSPEELLGKTSVDLGVDEELAYGNPEKNIQGFYADDDWVLETGKTKRIPSEPIVLDGQLRYLSTVKIPLYDALNERPLVLGLAHDITYLKDIESKIGVELRYNKTLNEINKIFHLAECSSSIYEKVCRVTLDALQCSRVRIVINGSSKPECIAEYTNFREPHVDAASQLSHQFKAVLQYAEKPVGFMEIENRNGEKPFSAADKRLVQAVSNHLALAIQQHQLNHDIHHQALHDSLTNLPNRHMLTSALNKTVAASKEHDTRCAMILLDLDGFKHINDTMGHQAGDQLLLAVANRLQEINSSSDLLVRLGGDEFAVLIGDMKDREYAIKIAEHFLEQLQAPFQIGDRELFVGASIGISVFPDDAQDSGSLMKHADMAMYESKNNGKNAFQVFLPSLADKAHRRQELEAALRFAISQEEELSLVYQPKICMKTGRPVGVEALLRWESPELGKISPVEIIPIAEESGLIIPLGQWILKTACREVGRWNSGRTEKIALSVNASPVELEQQDFVSSVRSVLKETSFVSTLLEFEVTETMFMNSFSLASNCLQELRSQGVSVSVDDFGTGYSCMSYLQKLPVDTLKIDKSFVDLLDSAPADTPVNCELTIAATIVSLAKSLKLKTVAEGIETEHQAELLRQIGADMGQGYYYSKPLPPWEAEEFMSRIPL